MNEKEVVTVTEIFEVSHKYETGGAKFVKSHSKDDPTITGTFKLHKSLDVSVGARVTGKGRKHKVEGYDIFLTRVKLAP